MSNRKADSFCLPRLLSRTVVKVISVAALLPLFSLVPTQAAAGPMKLLSPHAGWLAYGNKLYWTNDSGKHWTDITPIPPGLPLHASNTVSSIFFRDTSDGWAIVSYREAAASASPASPNSMRMAYSVAHTEDSGTNWSFVPLTYPELPQWIQDTFAGPADLYFLDSQHGWLDVAFEGNLKPGKLLATEDGGKTWHWVGSPPVSGPITFVSLQDGWLLSNFGADSLYVTHDGCKTWQEVSLSPPPQVGAATHATFQSTPVFQDQQRGYLVVYYSGGPGVLSKLVIYSTVDSGRTWQPLKVLPEAREASGAQFAVVDSNIIVSTGSTPRNISVTAVPLRGGASSDINASNRGIIALTFADTANGWVLNSNGRLLATHDGGSTWTDITPSHGPSLPAKTVPGRIGPAMNVTYGDLLSSTPEAIAANSTGGSHISKHLGFDIAYVRSISDMETWWKYSPYYDTLSIFPALLTIRRTTI